MRDMLLCKVRPVGIDVHGDASAVGWVYARHGVASLQTVPRWLRGVGFRESGKPLRTSASDWAAASPIISGPAFQLFSL